MPEAEHDQYYCIVFLPQNPRTPSQAYHDLLHGNHEHLLHFDQLEFHHLDLYDVDHHHGHHLYQHDHFPQQHHHLHLVLHQLHYFVCDHGTLD